MSIHKTISRVHSLKREPVARHRPNQQGNAAEELISTPSSIRRTRRSIVIEDELDGDFDILSGHDDESHFSGRGANSKSATKSLKGVVIPASHFKAPAGRGRPIPTKSASSVSSVLSSRRDQSSEYDTPGTSTVATPAESTIKVETSSRLTMRGNAAAQMQHRRTLPLSGAGGKRKREEADDLAEATMEADALLAQALQEEEYQEVAPNRGNPAKARRLVEDSEGDSISDLSSDFSASETPIDVDRSNAKRIKTGGRMALPSRAARDSARKSIADKASIGIMDTEDSELSDYISEFDSEDLDSEGSGGEEEDLLQQPEVTATSAPTPSARRPHRIRRARTMPSSTATRTGPASWMSSRVRSIISWLVILLKYLIG